MRSKSKEVMQDICRFVDEFSFEYRRSPSTQEIADAIGAVKSTAYKYLVAMDKLGMISYDGRTIETTGTRKSDTEVNRAPIIGTVQCGAPTLEEENFEEYVALPVSLFGKGEFFILRARGESMIEAGIEPGDLVVVRKQNYADDGDIVVALVDNCTTLKTFYRDEKKRRVVLHPENAQMEDIYPDECYIQGVAEDIIKPLKKRK
ncbi:MAG TPA: transcriptional repressor LexA [Bacillota bacterium]|nr:transcriptional repressor LexA [Bacillota bacterium]